MRHQQRKLELKAELSKSDAARLAGKLPRRGLSAAPPLRTKIRSIYFDTPGRHLHAAGISLRLRRESDGWLQTVAADDGGSFNPIETEVAVDDEEPDIARIGDRKLRRAVRKAAKKYSLRPVSETLVRRMTRSLKVDGSEVELVVDEGQVLGGGAGKRRGEAGLELTSGTAVGLLRAAQTLLAGSELKSISLSEAGRGHRQAGGKDGTHAQPVTAGKLHLGRSLYADLQDAAAYLAEAQRLSHTGSFGWNVSSGGIVWSKETFQIFGFDRATEPKLELIIQRTHPEDVDRVRQFVDRAPRDGRDLDLEHRLLMPDGSIKHLHVVAHAVKDESEKLEFVGAVMDVTASKQAQARLQASLAEKEALLKEVHHRVKNNLQLITSLLTLQSARTDDPAVAQLLSESRDRVRSMALVHENLYRAGDFARVRMGPHIQNLCAHLVRTYGPQSQRVEVATEIDDMELGLDRAIPVGLIVNELVSNALKHAFPGDRAGCVRVELKHLDERQCALAVIDDGHGLPPEADHADSLGLQLVRDLAHQLHGTMTVRRDGGTAFTVSFDAADRGGTSR